MKIRFFLLLLSGMLFTGCFQADLKTSGSDKSSKSNETEDSVASENENSSVASKNTAESTPPKLSTVSGRITIPAWEARIQENATISKDGVLYMDNYEDYAISASYLGVLESGTTVGNSVRFPFMGSSVPDVKILTHEPRDSALRYVVGEGWRFEHVELPAGRYCFVFGWTPDTYHWVWKEIKEGEDVSFDVEINTEEQSKLVVSAQPDSKVWLNVACPSSLDWSDEARQGFDTHRWSIIPWDDFRPDYVVGDEGELTMLGLTPGEYCLYCLKKGADKAQRKNVKIDSNQEVAIEFDQ